MRLLSRTLLLLIVLGLFVWSALPVFFGHLPSRFREPVREIVSMIVMSERLPGAISDDFREWATPITGNLAVGGPREGVALGGPETALDERPVRARAYDRKFYGDWADPDGDCLNTRAEVLADLSTSPVAMRPSGCSVGHGRWSDPYTGKIFTEADVLDIDHIVPLAWAHAHGAASWPARRKIAFANWKPNLMAVDATENRRKGARGPDEWLPPNVAYRCEYLARFQRIALQWGLEFSAVEKRAMDAHAARWCQKDR